MTMPDGQGQTGTFNLDTAARVEYLRGHFLRFTATHQVCGADFHTRWTEEPTLSGGSRLVAITHIVRA